MSKQQPIALEDLLEQWMNSQQQQLQIINTLIRSLKATQQQLIASRSSPEIEEVSKSE